MLSERDVNGSFRHENYILSKSMNRGVRLWINQFIPDHKERERQRRKGQDHSFLAFKVDLYLLLKVHDGERPVWLQEASNWSTVFRGSTWVFLRSAGLLQIRGRKCCWTLPQWLCTAGEHTTMIQCSSPIHISGHYKSDLSQTSIKRWQVAALVWGCCHKALGRRSQD